MSRSSSRIELSSGVLDLGENPRRNAGGEMAKKQGFHVFLSPTQIIASIVALPLAVAKGLDSGTPYIANA